MEPIRLTQLDHLQSLIKNRNILKGMNRNVNYVTLSSDSRNKGERLAAIQFTIGLSRYLCHQGVDRREMVIATMGDSDKYPIIKTRKNLAGEEGQEHQVLVSTVAELRGSKEVGILFLGNQIYHNRNRPEIAEYFTFNFFSFIQKIRRGVIIIGAESCLAVSHDTRIAFNLLRTYGLMQPFLHIGCDQHSFLKMMFLESSFPPSGGCGQVCMAVMGCGHPCYKLCHPSSPSAHGEPGGICTKTCLRKCSEHGHACSSLCHFPKDCPPCTVVRPKHRQMRLKGLQPLTQEKEKLMTLFPCGHKLYVSRSEAMGDVGCRIPIKVPRCKHLLPEKIECSQRNKSLPKRKCGSDCWEKLECSPLHQCLQPCEGVSMTPEEHRTKHPCQQSCDRICKNGHRCNPKHLCTEPCSPCTFKLSKMIPAKNIRSSHSRGNNPQGLELMYECHEEEEFINKIQHDFKNYRFINPPEVCKKMCRRGRHLCPVLHSSREKCPPCTESHTIFFNICRHDLVISCEDRDEDIVRKCKELCGYRNRVCDHPCFLICGQHQNGQCPPCKVVTTLKPCGHEWTHPCCQELPVDDKCVEIIDATRLATCGHPDIRIECYLTKGMEVGEANMYCTATCGFYFDPSAGGCGHNCKGTCQDCSTSQFHLECSEITSRTNICGHEVRVPCYVSSPCTQVCETSCSHRRCALSCALPCIPCEEPCVYECPHGKCKNLCGEPCSRKPCANKCPKILKKCNHPCVGFCGEPCPSLCAICDKEVLLATNFMGKDCIGPLDRFIMLHCGHTFDSDSLDKLMTVETVTGQITVKRCPLCCQVIRNIPRYASVLRRIQKDIESVKEILCGRRFEVLKVLSETISLIAGMSLQVEENRGREPEFLMSLRFSILKEISKHQSQSQNEHEAYCQVLSLEKATCLNFIAKFYSKALQLWIETRELILGAELFDDWENYVQGITDFLKNRHYPLKHLDMTRVAQEWDRVVALSKLLRKESDSQPAVVKRLLRQPKTKKLYFQAMEILTRFGPYNTESRETFERVFAELEVALMSKLSITEDERMGILKAFDYSVGRWFRCPNGHIYVVTECGGVTEEGKCNECGALIGGSYHRVLPTNQLATDMDGAVGPLYPTVFEAAPY